MHNNGEFIPKPVKINANNIIIVPTINLDKLNLLFANVLPSLWQINENYTFL